MLIIGSIYADLQCACFAHDGENKHKKDAVDFFRANNFPLPSVKNFNVIKSLCKANIFNAGAMLTGTYAYRFYYSCIAFLPPKYFHCKRNKKIARMKKWNGDKIHLISRIKNEAEIFDAFGKSNDFIQKNEREWEHCKTKISIILEDRKQDKLKQQLQEFLARDQIPAVVCFRYGLPIAIPSHFRMVIYRLCSAQLRENDELRQRDLALAADLLQFCEIPYLVEMFEQLAELGQDTRDFLKIAMDALSEDMLFPDFDFKIPKLKTETLKLVGKARLNRPRRWKEKRSDLPLQFLGMHMGC